MPKLLEFDEWFELYEDDITCAAAETGADRELDYDAERFQEELYMEYEARFDQSKEGCSCSDCACESIMQPCEACIK